jgi:hypothetical protein
MGTSKENFQNHLKFAYHIYCESREFISYFVIFVISFLISYTYFAVHSTIFAFLNFLYYNLYLNLVYPLFEPFSIAIFLFLISISIYLFYSFTGHDQKLCLYGVNAALFCYFGFIIMISGIIILGFSPVPSSINTTSDSIQDHVSNILFPNVSYPFNSDIQKLNSGFFGNGIGFFGLGLAIIILGLNSYDKIATSRKEEKILLYLQNREYLLKNYKQSLEISQIYDIGMIWVNFGLFFTLLYFITSVRILFNFEIVGVIILLYGYLKSKKEPQEPEEYTFDELIQKINDESTLRKTN